MRRYKEDVLLLNLGVARLYVVTHPRHVEHVLVHNHKNYWKGTIFGRAKILFGDGLVLSEGDYWRQQRQLIQPTFTHTRLAPIVPIITQVVQRKVDKWAELSPENRALDIEEEMTSLTLEVMAKTMFNLSIDDSTLEMMAWAFNAVLKHIGLRFATFFVPEWVPLPGRSECDKGLKALDDLVYRIIGERRKEVYEHSDLLSMLLSSKDDQTGRELTDRQLRDEVITMLFGGFEATADALAWTWYLLSQNPGCDRKFREELASVVGNGPLSFEHLSKLTYTRMIIEESLRLYPPFWEIFRTSHAEDRIDGFMIPANSLVLLCPYATHRHPDYWDQPDSFNPERFSSERSAGRHRCAHIPFAAGPRHCIGKHMAMMEIQIALALIALHYRPTLPPGHRVQYEARGSLRPRGHLLMEMEPA
jgi:cytochrome P450